MTQCKEIAKQLKKMLSIYSIEEKESELLPEFTEPFRFQETLFQQCRNAADELSYLGSCLSCESGDFPDMFYGIYQGNRLHFASSATLDGGCNHVRFFGVSVTALACNDREFVEKAMPHSLGLCGTAVPYDTIPNLFMGIFYKDEMMMNEALVLAEKFLARKQRKYDILIVQYLMDLWEKRTENLTELIEQICIEEQRVTENTTYIGYGNEKYNKVINIFAHGLFALAEHYLGVELFETIALPNVKSFCKEYELYRCGHKQNGELLVNYPENYGYLNQISDLIPQITLKENGKKKSIVDTELFADELFQKVYSSGKLQHIVKRDIAWIAAWGTTEEFLQKFREDDEMQYFYDRGLIYYALSNPDMGSCYEISSFLLSRYNKEKKTCILEKKTRDFDGPYHMLFRRKNYDVLQTAELCEQLFEAGADPNQAGEKNVLPIELMMALPFTEEELHPLYDIWMKLPAVDLKLHTFDGKQPIDFAKKYKRKKLATWIKAQL